ADREGADECKRKRYAAHASTGRPKVRRGQSLKQHGEEGWELVTVGTADVEGSCDS
ncbi:MAG: hypothetical protein QOI71_3501, partial [Gaiellales bacterium]|nr:hypothetical protein [Gaiellales bacterium]